MKTGDLVRFRPPYYIASVDGVLTPEREVDWLIGLLLEYHKWEKIATILYSDEHLRVPARDVQKLGKGCTK